MLTMLDAEKVSYLFTSPFNRFTLYVLSSKNIIMIIINEIESKLFVYKAAVKVIVLIRKSFIKRIFSSFLPVHNINTVNPMLYFIATIPICILLINLTIFLHIFQ